MGPGITSMIVDILAATIIFTGITGMMLATGEGHGHVSLSAVRAILRCAGQTNLLPSPRQRRYGAKQIWGDCRWHTMS